MKSFITWTNVLMEASAGADADREGKVHELAVGWHLNHLIHGSGAHMAHFRDEHGNTPEEAMRHHTENMTQEQKEHHNRKAQQAAHAIYDNIKKTQPHILKPNKSKGEHVRVTWTSQGGDIKNLTGKEDKAQHAGGADVMVSKHNKHGHVENDNDVHGASLKYLKKKSKVTLSNRGTGSLEKQLGMPKGSLTKHDEDHDNRMTEHFGGEKRAGARHKIFKTYRDNPNRSEKDEEFIKKVKSSDSTRNSAQAKAIADHLNSMHPDHRREHLKSLFGPEHTHPTHQYRTNSDSDDPTHVEKGSDVAHHAFSGEHHVVAEGGILRVKRGTKENPGKSIGQIEFRAKGKPAGGASQAQPSFTAEASKGH